MPTSTKVFYKGQLLNDQTMSMESGESVEVEYQDCFREVSNGGLQRAERKFVVVSRKDQEFHKPPSFPKEETVETSETSKLEGRTLSLSWSGTQRRYELGIDEQGKPLDVERLRDAVSTGVSQSDFSPQGATGERKKWEIPFEHLRDFILAPGGDLFSYQSPNSTTERQFASRQRTEYWKAMKGKVEAEVQGVLDADPKCVKIGFRGEATVQCSLTFDPSGSDPRGRGISETATFTGVAIWNEDHGRLESVGVEWIGRIRMSQDTRIASAGGDWGKSEMEFDEQANWNLSCSYGRSGESAGK